MQYEHYPQQSVIGTAQSYPFNPKPFSTYTKGQPIAESRKKNNNDDYIVTSGVLWCREYNGVTCAYTNTPNFRMLINSKNEKGFRVRYTDFAVTFTVIPVSITEGPNWSGIHIFSRYQTENDLYVASFRVDGQIVIKKKIRGQYTTLAQKKANFLMKFHVRYTLTFTVTGNMLVFTVLYNDTKEILKATDNDLTNGTGGIRIDNTECYIGND
jgi:hypothetical protein